MMLLVALSAFAVNQAAAAKDDDDGESIKPADKLTDADKDFRDAVESGDLEAVRKHIEQGANPLSKCGEQYTPVAIAARAGQVTVVEYFLAHGVEIDSVVKSDGSSLLHVASHAGQLEMVRWLLDHGAQVDSQSHFDTTPLMEAAQFGHGEVVHLLLEHGANPNSRDIGNGSVLYAAAQSGDCICLRAIVEAGADLIPNNEDKKRIKPDDDCNVWDYLSGRVSSHQYDEEDAADDTDGRNGSTPPADASKPSPLATNINYLLSKGLQLDPGSEAATMLLMKAAQVEDFNAAECLLKQEVSANDAFQADPDEDDQPLSPKMVRWLQAHGAELTKYPQAMDILFMEAVDGNDLKRFDKLIADGLSPSLSVFSSAAEAGQLAMVRSMEARGLNPKKRPKDSKGHPTGDSPMVAAASAPNDEVLAHFIETKAADAGDPALLAAAAEAGSDANIRLLIAHGADVNALRPKGRRTALHLAAQGGYAKAVSALLAAGANRDLKDAKGKTPAELAKENDHPDVVKLLTQ